MRRGRATRSALLDNGTVMSEEEGFLEERKCFVGDIGKEKVSWDKSDAVFVFQQCLISRFYIFLVQFFFNILFPDHPTDAFKGVKDPNEGTSFVDLLVRKSLSGFARWDAVHFLHIAEYGYTYENNLAFFPFFPFLVYFIGLLWHWMVPFLSFSTVVLVTSTSINLVAFLIGGQFLYIMLLYLSKSRKRALIGCIVFSLNPSSIFFSAAYSEGLFFTLSLGGMLILYTSWVSSTARYYMSACVFAFAFLTRSNGLLNFGYIGYQLMLEVVYCPVAKKFLWEEEPLDIIIRIGRAFYISVICFGICSGMVILHGLTMHSKFCSVSTYSANTRLVSPVINFAREYNLVLPGETEKIDWCRLERSFYNPLPVFYAPLQRKYWDVGFLQYWQPIKIPCFLLATPALIIVTFGVIQSMRKSFCSKTSMLKAVSHVLRDRYNTVPFVLHATFLSLSGIFVYNVEVVTRMLFASTPFMYLVLANFMHSRTPHVTIDDIKLPRPLPFLTNFCRTRLLHKLLLCYLLGYSFIGSALHVNWLPFV